jgi:hypothetical protein
MHHGLKYKKLVGDGDSSVYNKIKNIKPYGPNFYVEKFETIFYAIIVIKSKNLQNVQNLVRKYGVYFVMFCGSGQE